MRRLVSNQSKISVAYLRIRLNAAPRDSGAQLSSVLLWTLAPTAGYFLAPVLYDHLPSPSLTKNSSPYHFAHDADDSWYVKQRLRLYTAVALCQPGGPSRCARVDLGLGHRALPCGFVRDARGFVRDARGFVRDARALLLAGQRGPSLWLRGRDRATTYLL